MGFTIVSGKVSVYQSLLGNDLEKFEGGWISMIWLKDNFNELPKDPEDRIDEEMCWATLLSAASIGGCRLLLQSWAWWWNHGPSYVGLPEYLKDIRLLLDQCSKASLNGCRTSTPISYPASHRECLQSAVVRCKGTVGSVCNGGNARNKSGIAVFWVKTTNFVAIARPKGAAQGGHAEEGQHRLVSAAQRAHRDVNVEPHVRIYADIPTITYASTHAAVDGDVDAQYLFNMPGIWNTL
ncbi:hypothetical protein Goshw_013753 [Gossypium schwendimanii]|uniref:Uncharacterized protein n=1 Tax=Gossypium schwendimanii TaxID=34291 RepID=A0A7J9LFD2_GOSSC|nr:hypothetical protein [Gossypium schwendimanii]